MRLSFSVLVLLVAAALGCGQEGKVLGKTPKERPSTILAINAGDAPPRVTLEGVMIEKCPQAGCWFRVDDGTGVIKVDTKAAGFVVNTIPLNSKITVAGKLITEGSEQQLEATGMVY